MYMQKKKWVSNPVDNSYTLKKKMGKKERWNYIYLETRGAADASVRPWFWVALLLWGPLCQSLFENWMAFTTAKSSSSSWGDTHSETAGGRGPASSALAMKNDWTEETV
jgi:hypothetical protein